MRSSPLILLPVPRAGRSIPDMAKSPNLMGVGIALGICMGVAIGAALHKVAIGIAMGTALGAALGVVMNKRSNDSH